MAAQALPLELRGRLDAEPARGIIEYLVDRLGLTTGHQHVELHFDDGRLHKAYLHRGPMGVEAIEQLAARDAPGFA
jgi:hypothetical protein